MAKAADEKKKNEDKDVTDKSKEEKKDKKDKKDKKKKEVTLDDLLEPTLRDKAVRITTRQRDELRERMGDMGDRDFANHLRDNKIYVLRNFVVTGRGPKDMLFGDPVTVTAIDEGEAIALALREKAVKKTHRFACTAKPLRERATARKTHASLDD